jgi:hypothetical protein
MDENHLINLGEDLSERVRPRMASLNQNPIDSKPASSPHHGTRVRQPPDALEEQKMGRGSPKSNSTASNQPKTE